MDPLQDHLRLVDGLRRALAAAPGGAPVQVLHTHLSTVLLAADSAWKLKKPLATGFADFSTLQRRRHFCEEELRLNRRTAPGLYLDVRPVVGTPQQPRFGETPAEDRTALDWALRMRRFDGGALLSELARQGRLTAALADRLAQRVAAFHAGLAPSPPGFGAPQGVLRWALDNLRELADEAPAQAARLAALEQWTRAEFERIAQRLAQRLSEGRVRECHGDLHLANLVLIDGEPLPFDAIEFDPELRHIDVASDAAFPFMDLMAHGLPRLAWRFVSGWSEATGDRGALALLPFFSVYRALVRAKVALLRAGQLAPESGEGLRQLAAFQSRLALAETLARPRPRRLVLTCGLSGSGKSSVAQGLLEALGAVRLRSDVERKRLFGMAPTERPAVGSALYGPDATRRTYAELEALARTLLEGGTPVVIDAAFLRRGERDAMRALAAGLGARFALVECRASHEVLRTRLRERSAAGEDPSDAGESVLDLQLRVHEPLGEDERAHAWTIDTDIPRAELAALADAVAAALGRE
ncbi:AAA family ATPase [Caldimonas tepidiphila]|uniref:bifunctional aminoglycoside phosphotransferase/ATP-binding protein n=1 Tax=Caldimonas tepidiphila TaxID=2315841 RepID=UPI000E5B48C0|nr:bifunctional aminoglycoside phosphotransferase/ATP-binding protein [Caldimonas tepidiphila]